MADLTASIKRVPRWAWLTSAGVGIGAIGVYTFRNRATGDTEEPTDPNSAVTGYPTSDAASPVPGIVVPSINLPSDDSGQQGTLDLHNLYVGALTDFFDFIGSTYAMPSPSGLVVPSDGVGTGGGAPSTSRPGVVTVAPPPPQQTVKPCCMYHGHPLSWWRSPSNAKCNNGKWNWPGPGGCKQSRPFEGHQACDGGGNAPGSHREC